MLEYAKNRAIVLLREMTFYFRFYCTPFSCCEMTLSSFSSYLRYVVDFTDVNLSKSLVIARKAPDFNMILTGYGPRSYDKFE